jgi:hypothetical protein
MDSDRRSAQVERLEVVDTAGGGAGRRVRSSRSSLRVYRRRAGSRQQRAGMAFRGHCCCDGDARFGPIRKMPPINLASYRR